MPDINDLITQLSGIRANQRDKGRAVNVAGHLVQSVLKERWDPLSEQQRQRLVLPSAERLRKNYVTNMRRGQSTKEAAKQAIAEELKLLGQTLSSN